MILTPGARKRVALSERYSPGGTASSYSLGTKPFALGAQSGLALFRYDAANAGAISYIISRLPSGGNGYRWFFTDNAAQPNMTIGFDSTGTAGNPFAVNNVVTIKVGRWYYAAYTHDGGLLASGISMYLNAIGAQTGGYTAPLATIVKTSTADGTTAYSNDAANALVVGDRNGGARNWVGAIGFVAQWNRVLTLAELEYAKQAGPLAVQNGLVLCWSGGHDYGPYGNIGTPSGIINNEGPSYYPLGPRGNLLPWMMGGTTVAVPPSLRVDTSPIFDF